MSKEDKNPYHNESMWRGAYAQTFANAQKLRKLETEAETLLWEKIKAKQLSGFKFRRQHPIQSYIADFYCHEAQLIIELDGEYHETEEQQKKDSDRENELIFQGIKILRFTNTTVLNDIQSVLKQIKEVLPEKK